MIIKISSKGDGRKTSGQSIAINQEVDVTSNPVDRPRHNCLIFIRLRKIPIIDEKVKIGQRG